MEKILIEVKNLTKYFPAATGRLHAVDDVSFSLARSKTLGVVGESGCGKSTLGRLVARILPVTSGRIIFEGEDITEAPSSLELRKKMQMIFQDPFSSLNPRMSVAQIIAEPLKIHGLYSQKSEIRSQVEELMEIVGLAPRFLSSYPHELDGGRRQRVGIARALALKPSLLVCDEPVSALDVSIQAQILNLLLDLQEKEGFSYLFISHDMSVIKHMSQEVMVMYLGQLVEMAPTGELFSNTLHPYSRALLGAIPSVDMDNKRIRRPLKGEVGSAIDPKRGCRFAPRCEYAKRICFENDPSLEEILPGHYVSCLRVREISGIK